MIYGLISCRVASRWGNSRGNEEPFSRLSVFCSPMLTDLACKQAHSQTPPSGIHTELRRAQLLVGGQQQGEIVGVRGIGVEVLRAGSPCITAVDITPQHAD